MPGSVSNNRRSRSRPSLHPCPSSSSLRDAPFPLENGFRRAGHQHGASVASPCDRHHAAASRYAHGRIDQPAANPRDYGRAGARAARERLSRAALPYPQANVSAIDDLHVTGVDPSRKARMRLDARALCRDGRRARIDDHLDGVRVAERQRRYHDGRAVDIQRLDGFPGSADERNIGRAKLRCAHVHGDLAIRRQHGLDDSARRLDAHCALVGQSARAHEMHEAARAVAALFDLFAVGVEDSITKVDVSARRLLDKQYLVAADAEMAVCQPANLHGLELDLLADSVEHHEIVAQALHFGEAQAPGHCGREPNRRSNRATGISPLREKARMLPSRSVTLPLKVYATGTCDPRVISAVATAVTSTRPASSTLASPPAGNRSTRALRPVAACRPSSVTSYSIVSTLRSKRLGLLSCRTSARLARASATLRMRTVSSVTTGVSSFVGIDVHAAPRTSASSAETARLRN